MVLEEKVGSVKSTTYQNVDKLTYEQIHEELYDVRKKMSEKKKSVEKLMTQTSDVLQDNVQMNELKTSLETLRLREEVLTKLLIGNDRRLVIKNPDTGLIYGEYTDIDQLLIFLNYPFNGNKVEETISWHIFNGEIERWLERIGEQRISKHLRQFRGDRSEFVRVFVILYQHYYKNESKIELVGYNKERKEIMDLCIRAHEHPEVSDRYGLRKGGSVLLYGPPGCGKTAIAKDIAKRSKKMFLQIPSTEFMEGRTKVFDTVKRIGNMVVFIDEMEPASPHRAIFKGTKPSQLLDMIGDELFEKGVILIGATNIPWVIEPALLRSGRMDRLVYVGVPDSENREKLFRLYTKDRMFGPLQKEDYEVLVKKSRFFSCSDIKEVCSRACYGAWEEAISTTEMRRVRKEELIKAIEEYDSTATLWFKNAMNTCFEASADKRFKPMMRQIEMFKDYNGDNGMSR